jgi:hypothetical protein
MDSALPLFINRTTRSAYSSESEIVNYINNTFKCSRNAADPQIPQPHAIKIPLRDHQRTSAAALKAHEARMHAGIKQHDISGNAYFTRSSGGILGDPVGAGKSLTVLSYIADMKENPPANPEITLSYIKTSRTTNNYTVYTRRHDRADPKNCKNLIVVPYSLVPQWRQYVKTQTSLNAHIIKTRADISSNIAPIQAADLTIVSNTMYSDFIDIVNDNNIWWERAFFDEADSIKISARADLPTALFTWYITASWQNIALDNYSLHNRLMETIVNSPLFATLSPGCVNWIAEYLHSHTGSYHRYDSFRSNAFLPHLASIADVNSYINIIQSSLEYYRQSFCMPPVTYKVHRCRRSAINRTLAGLIDPHVQQLVDADDIEGALGILQLKTHTSTNLLGAVEHRYIRDISNIELTISYRAAMEYVSTTQKDEALASLRRSKERVETQLASFRQRIADLSGELCPICYDVPEERIYVSCCNHLYCSPCILKCLRMKGSCPMCRATVNTQDLVHVRSTDPAISTSTSSAPPRKHEILLSLFKENPRGKFLVFSDYDNPFNALGETCAQENIKYKIIRGNGASIDKSIQDFEKGKIRVLFMNSRELGVGLNIVAATDVVIYHALNQEEEKQVVGRALRMGRTAPLTVHKLLHEGEQAL